jgi:cytochrome c2
MHSQHRRCFAVMAIVAAAAVSVTAQGAAAGQRAAGDPQKGAQTVQQVCVACHNNALKMIQRQKRTPDQWRDTMYAMIGRGAHIYPEEFESLVAFLAENSGRTPAATGGSLPAGQTAAGGGRAILERACQECHDLDTATKRPGGKDWGTVVATMVGHGAKVSVADQQILIAYLNTLPQ